MPDVPQWARVRGDVNCNVRRGAWYEVLRLTPEEAILEVERRSVSVPRSSLQIVPVRPQRWSVVARPSDAVSMLLSLGSRYAVCPNCHHRAPLKGHVTEMRCARCNGVFDVDYHFEGRLNQDFAFPLMHSQGYYSSKSLYNNPRADKLVAEGVASLDPRKREQVYRQLQDLAHDDLPFVNISVGTRYRTQRSWVKGWTFSPVFPGSPYDSYYYDVYKAE